MIVVRDVWQAKYGKGDDLVAHFKKAQQNWPDKYADRIFTDASGTFFTVVTETDVESLAGWEDRTANIFSLPEFGEWFERMTDLVDGGRREFWNQE